MAGLSDVAYAPADTSMLDQEALNKLPHYKFAFSYYAFTDKLSQQFKGCLEYLGAAFNVEFVFFEATSASPVPSRALSSPTTTVKRPCRPSSPSTPT